MSTVKHNYQQGYFAGIKWARNEAVATASKEKARVQRVCLFWAVVSFVAGAVLF